MKLSKVHFIKRKFGKLSCRAMEACVIIWRSTSLSVANWVFYWWFCLLSLCVFDENFTSTLLYSYREISIKIKGVSHSHIYCLMVHGFGDVWRWANELIWPQQKLVGAFQRWVYNVGHFQRHGRNFWIGCLTLDFLNKEIEDLRS